MKIRLERAAHCRSGDKGNTSNISVIAYAPELYPFLKGQLTAGRFRGAKRPSARRDRPLPTYALPPEATHVGTPLPAPNGAQLAAVCSGFRYSRA